MLKSLYTRVLALSASRHAPLWLALVSFVESSFFPIPPDVLLVPMVAARPERAWRLALICTVSSVLGGLLGYAIGYAFYDQVALPLIRFFHYETAAASFTEDMQTYGPLIILIKGVIIIIPFKLVTIASGAAKLNLFTFVVACSITRAGRFFAEAALLKHFGAPVMAVVERRLALVTALIVVAGVATLVLFRFL